MTKITYWSNGNIKEELPCDDRLDEYDIENIWNGVCKRYRKEGGYESIVYWKNNLTHGTSEHWFNNNGKSRTMIEQFNADEIHGITVDFYY